jgi:hypothetical protein
MHRGLHVHIVSIRTSVIDYDATLRNQIVREDDAGHGASTHGHVFLLRLLGACRMRNEILRYPVHVEIEVLICVHVRCRYVRVRMLVDATASTCDPTGGIHAVQLFLLHTVECRAQLLRYGQIVLYLLGYSLRRHLGAF